jgi:ABC-type branched-subunit amino acid transport system substrate-binding protein
VHAAAANTSIKGLIGWPGLLDSPSSLAAVDKLQAAHIPIVSSSGYDEAQFVANVFHVAPSYQDQGRRAALYAENVLQKSRAVVITDPLDAYSRGLAEGFKERFEEDGDQITGVQTYRTGQTDAQTLIASLHSLLATNPDFIYFTGGPTEGQILLAQLRAESSPLPMLGGDELYSFVGFSENTRPDFERLAFTSSAYPDTPTAVHMKELYALAFDAQDPDHVREYGYSRPDDQSILSYDAMETFIAASADASGLQSLQQVLPSVRVFGASRKLISFSPFNELNDQSLLMLFANQQEQISFKVI